MEHRLHGYYEFTQVEFLFKHNLYISVQISQICVIRVPCLFVSLWCEGLYAGKFTSEYESVNIVGAFVGVDRL